MVCVFSVWAGSSAWLGALTLRIERPPYTRKPSSEGRRVGSSNLPRPTRIALAIFEYPLSFFSAAHVFSAICLGEASCISARTIQLLNLQAFESESAIPTLHH